MKIGSDYMNRQQNSTNINWYPGHMAKAQREILEKVKLVDIVIVLVDARAPYSSKNPLLDEWLKNKPCLIIMTKKDMADSQVTQSWIEFYQQSGQLAMAVDLKHFTEYKKVISLCQSILKDKMEKEQKRGLKPRAIRAMVLGIPNVGKSTFINCLARRKATMTGNKPGVTKSQQIIKVDKDFELFDTPGVLWPKFENQDVARNIALIGSIKQTILPVDELCVQALNFLKTYYPSALQERYQLDLSESETWLEETFEQISKVRGIKKVRQEVDVDRVIEVVLNDIRLGAFGPISFERVDDAHV